MSRRTTWTGALAPVVACVLLSTAAQLLLKAGMTALLRLSPDWTEPATVLASGCLTDIGGIVMAGLACYVVSLFVWIGALARIDLSVAYPMLSSSYVLVYLVATRSEQLAEAASITRGAGILLVVLGIGAIVSTAGDNS